MCYRASFNISHVTPPATWSPIVDDRPAFRRQLNLLSNRKKVDMKRPYWFLVLIWSLGFTFASLGLLNGSIPFLQADSPHHVALDCTSVPAPCHTSLQAAVD